VTNDAAHRATPEGDRDATPNDPELTTRLAVAEAELLAIKDMLTELRQSRDDWKAQAERLVLSPPTKPFAPPTATAPSTDRRRPWRRRLVG
jgi:hypothetical protein